MIATTSISALQSAIAGVISELHAKADCQRLGLSAEAFASILLEVGKKYLPASANESDARAFVVSLRVEELALARACAAGHEFAWELFLTRYREKLYQSALRIARENSAARELADTLYADLYGTITREGKRVCKLSSYTGRGSLEGWLRTVLAQEYVNRYRRQKRLVSLEEESEDGRQFQAPEPQPAASAASELELSTDEALATLSGEDRLVLSAYFLDQRTLADIARMLGVHESTISRKLDKLAKTLRKQILAGLGRRGLSRRQAEEALEVDVRDVQLDIRRSLGRERRAQESPDRAFSEKTLEVKAVRARTRPETGAGPDS